MSIADELTKLSQLKQDGLLSEEEFEQAKDKILNQDNEPDIEVFSSNSESFRRATQQHNSFRQATEHHSSIGNAANRYVSFHIIMSIIGFIIFLIIFMSMWKSSPFSSGPSFPSMNRFP